MNAAIIALVTAFAVPLGNATLPPISDDEAVEAADSQAPPEPTILEVAGDEVTQPDGRRVRWVSVTYELSSGQEAQAFVEIDELGSSDAVVYMDGEPIVHVTADKLGSTETWISPGIDLQPEALAELVGPTVADAVFSGIAVEPLSFPCSEYGEKVLKAGKYIWGALVIAGTAACCGVTSGVGCVLCHAGGLLAHEEGGEALEDYCA